jgi:hypothetical protein
MVNDLLQQKWLLIGVGAFLAALWLFSRRPAPHEQAARRLVRDLRDVDDADDVRGVLGSNVPTLLRPALLIGLEEAQHQVHTLFRQLERQIEKW